MTMCAKQCFICHKPEGNFDCLEQGCQPPIKDEDILMVTAIKNEVKQE